jgi:hypothetical protein
LGGRCLRGRRRRTTRTGSSDGAARRAPPSAPLANPYIRRSIAGRPAPGHERRPDAHIVDFADESVMRRGRTAAEAPTIMRGMTSRPRPTANEAKTRPCRVREGAFDLLGPTIGRGGSLRAGKSEIGTRPSAKTIARLEREISDRTSRRRPGTDVEDSVERLNRLPPVGFGRDGVLPHSR